jgi:hypothetical protein
MKSRPARHVQLEEVCGLQILAERGDSTCPYFCKSLILKEHSLKQA